MLVADAKDRDAVGKVLGQTKVVLATAGPFAEYGQFVVEQAVQQGTHYCDITGQYGLRGGAGGPGGAGCGHSIALLR